VSDGLLLAVAAGGLVGAPSRYLVDRAVTARIESELPWGTLLINVSGSFLLGLLTGLSLAGHLPLFTKTLFGVGFCGAYTTFSTFSYETLRLFEDGRLVEAGANVIVGVVVGMAVAAGGIAVGLAL
jgi:CrcB protein